MNVCAVRSQLAPFHASVDVPSPEIAATLPSSSDPSHLQTGIDFAATIQFPYGMSGKSGLIPAIFGPIQTAAPIQRVSVGVTNVRI